MNRFKLGDCINYNHVVDILGVKTHASIIMRIHSVRLVWIVADNRFYCVYGLTTCENKDINFTTEVEHGNYCVSVFEDELIEMNPLTEASDRVKVPFPRD